VCVAAHTAAVGPVRFGGRVWRGGNHSERCTRGTLDPDMPWNRCATFTGGLLRRPQKHQADGVLGYLGDRSGYEQGTRKRNAAFDHSRTLHDMRCHACRQAAVLIFNLEPLRTGDSNVDHVIRGSHIELLKSSPVEAATAPVARDPSRRTTVACGRSASRSASLSAAS